MRQTWGSNKIDFAYDDQGRPYSLTYNGTTYYYVLNLQGDVVRIVNASGVTQAEYTYNAWGAVTESDSLITRINPLRYRGYVYDRETGLYYLNSRYYDPANCRMLSPDDFSVLNASPTSLNDKNLFAYCDNNPVMRKDSDGQLWIVTVAVGISYQYASDVIGNIISGKNGIDILKPSSSPGEYVAAGITALIPGSGICAALYRNVISEVIVSVERTANGETESLSNSIKNIAVNTVADLAFEGITTKISNMITSRNPPNYSSYAKQMKRANPKISKQEIRMSLRKTRRAIRFANCTVAISSNVLRNMLPF